MIERDANNIYIILNQSLLQWSPNTVLTVSGTKVYREVYLIVGTATLLKKTAHHQ